MPKAKSKEDPKKKKAKKKKKKLIKHTGKTMIANGY